MNIQRYPHILVMYKGEGRILIVPLIEHIGGYSVKSSWFINIENMTNYVNIGESIVRALDFVKNSPLSSMIPKELKLEGAWKKNSNYKSWISFWKNNNSAHFMLFEDGHYEVYSRKKSENRKGNYDKCIKDITLSSDATPEEIGKAVIDVFDAAEEYYKENAAFDPYPTKKLELLDGSVLAVKHPKDNHFNDCEDGHAAEIYQFYSYLPKEDAESTAEFFVGMAFELDCNLDDKEIRSSWEDFYGKADFFDIREVDYGIFKLRIEMKNKDTHKISYILKMKEDLLLECGMDVHQPNRRKKLDERLADLFKEFALSCKM